MKKWKITGVIAAVLLLAVIGVCVYRANKDIPLAEKQYYKIGDTVAFDKDILVSGGSLWMVTAYVSILPRSWIWMSFWKNITALPMTF